MKTWIFLASIFFFLLTTALSTKPASAYVTGPRWQSNSVWYAINTTVASWGWTTAIATSSSSWCNAGSPFCIYKFTGTTSANSGGTNDGINVVGYSNLGSNNNGRVAVTRYWTSGSYIVEADFTFNTYYPFSVPGSSSAYDVQNTATHEFGHFVQLLHSSVGCGYWWEATMCDGTSKGETRKRSLETDDNVGVQALYGSL